MESFVSKLVNDDKVFNVFCNLFFRWEDECRYEDFSDYAAAMGKSVEKCVGGIEDVEGVESPFGIMFTKGGVRYELSFNLKDDDSATLSCRIKKKQAA